MYIRTFNERKEHLNRLATKEDLFNATIFWYSPLAEQVEERHIFADDNFEVIDWAQQIDSSYRKHNYDYEIYVNGQLQFSNGNIYKRFSCGE